MINSWLGQVCSFKNSLGWRVEGEIHDIRKFVIIAAPHTSNRDYPITLVITFALKIKNYWLGKAVMFRWPLGAAFRWLGGIPIDWSQSQNVVEQSVRAFKERDKLIMVISPLRERAIRSATGKRVFTTLPEGPTSRLCLDFSTTGAKQAVSVLPSIPRGVSKKICWRSRLSTPPSQASIRIFSVMPLSSHSAHRSGPL